MEAKQSIRREVFRRRSQVAWEEVHEKSNVIAERLLALSVWEKAACIYAYMDFNKEVVTQKMIEKAWALGKQVAVPRVHEDALVFYIISDFANCKKGYFGIREPSPDLPKADCESALMIVPGVAFDSSRHRVGYGKGFYDRYLHAHPGHITAATAFSWQIFEEVPSEPYDIKPKYLVTESGIFSDKAQRAESKKG